MRRIELNELPKWNPKVSPLLSGRSEAPLTRNREQVRTEYDAAEGKYAISLGMVRESGGAMSPDDVRFREFKRDPSQEICISAGDELYVTSYRNAHERYAELLRTTLAPALSEASSVVELGCGYGYNLWMLARSFPGKAYIGGDLSTVALELARELYGAAAIPQVVPFNFYDAEYSLFEGLEPPVLVFTCHAVEQLPSAVRMLEALAKVKDRIMRVFHFEPVYEMHEATLMGLLRRRYAESCDYNRDLYSELRKRRDIAVLRTMPDVLGLNPLNPSSVIEWKYP